MLNVSSDAAVHLPVLVDRPTASLKTPVHMTGYLEDRDQEVSSLWRHNCIRAASGPSVVGWSPNCGAGREAEAANRQ